MNRIALAYCHEQAELATQLDRRLIQIGIPFEHITDTPETPYGTFAQQLQQCTEPVLLIVTDNLLKSEACLTGLRQALIELLSKNQVVIAIADGRISKDGGQYFEPVTTHFDRMVYALQYMNFWQNAWLDMSSQQLHSNNSEEKALLGPKLEATRNIANEIGELITLLRETGYIEWPQLEADAYSAFFNRFGLSQWHEQYRQLSSLEQQQVEPPKKPEPALNIPTISGALTPIPIDAPKPEPEFSEMNSLLDELANEEPFEVPLSTAAHLEATETAAEMIDPEQEDSGYTETEIEQTIRDAWFWLEKGHLERGMELLTLAQEQHPDNEALKTAFANAQQQFKVVPEEPEVAPAQPTQIAPEVITQNDITANETHSYDLMGDMASEKGDYLFAKYCWDRVVEINPNFPNIYRKLGLMTNEHLRDYKETGLLYLQKALEQNPNDTEVLLAFADQSAQKEDKALAESYYLKALEIDPALRTHERDAQFLQPVHPEPIIPEPTIIPTEEPAPAAPQPMERPTPKPKEILTVMITGASSGIGRATAEVFAANGHRLILTGRREDRLSALKTQLQQDFQSDVLLLPFDVRDQATVQATIDHLPEDWQNIDVLINNAGGAKGLSPIHEGDIDHWETMIDTNLKGLLYVTRAVSPGMVQRRRGHIINLSSSAGKEVYVNGNVYCATKFAVEALSRAMRLDLHKFNIRVSQVSPGHVEETEFALNRFDGDAEKAKIYNDFQPLKASDVAETIYFIATRPPHVNIQDIWLFGTQQASATVIDRSGR
ncbi:MAG: SDR family NAD(P)-dependent oxidoreductase [Bacteroidota bacterium]|uniref:SDR family oxidoreductase n=1 Tax=Runella sp. TaxID=1960881 RepID=UPI003018E24A